jgi:hypothetical protein
MRAVPWWLSTNVSPAGRAPAIVIDAVGVPVVCTVKLNERPAWAKAKVPLVIVGARPTVSVKTCEVTPAELVALNVIGKVRPAIAADGVPESRAVPLAPERNVTPVGSVPDRVIVEAGYPVVVMVNENADPAAALAEAALVNAGGCATVITSC